MFKMHVHSKLLIVCIAKKGRSRTSARTSARTASSTAEADGTEVAEKENQSKAAEDASSNMKSKGTSIFRPSSSLTAR